MAGDMHGRGMCVVGVCACQGARMEGGVWKGGCVPGVM